MRISKIIHQTYYNKDELTPELIGNIEYLKNTNKDWDYRFYSDRDIFRYMYSNFGSEVVSRIKKINKKYSVVMADLFRYLVIYREGGVYLDIKSTASQSLSEIIKPDDAYLLSQWRNQLGFKFQGWGLFDELKNIPGGEFQTWFIAAEKNHKFLLGAIKNTLSNIDNYTIGEYGVGHKGVLRVSGPIMYTLSIAPLLKSNEFRIIDSADAGLIYSIYEGNHEHDNLFKYKYSTQTEPIIFVQTGDGTS